MKADHEHFAQKMETQICNINKHLTAFVNKAWELMMRQCNIMKELIDDLENLVHDNLESIWEEVGDLKNLVDDDWRQLQTWKQSIGVWVCELEED